MRRIVRLLLIIGVTVVSVFGSGRSLKAVSEIITPTTEAVFAGSIKTEKGLAAAVYLKDHYAYVAASRGGLKIINIAQPKAPELVETVWTDSAWDVTGRANHLFVADRQEGLYTIDISDPEDPTVLSIYPFMSYSVEPFGKDRVAITGPKGLAILSMADPVTPDLVAQLDTGSPVDAVCIRGNRAYMVDEDSPDENYMGRLIVVDISKLEAPRILSKTRLPGPGKLVMIGNYVYIVGGSIQIYDVSNPSNPRYCGRLGADCELYDADVAGKMLCVVGNNDCRSIGKYVPGGIFVFDASNPEKPKLKAAFKTPEALYGIKTRGNQIFVTSNFGLHILDASGLITH